MFWRPVVGVLLFVGILLPRMAFAESDAEDARLRVMTWNVWGIPVVSDAHESRMRRIGPAIAEHNPDVVALQEVWEQSDADRLARALENHGLPHTHHFDAGGVRSGLLVASVHPLEDAEFVPFRLGRMPEVPWHIDWIGDKGLGIVRLRTPQGPVVFANTHLQAAYTPKGYLAVRIAQALEVGNTLRDYADQPTVLAGDLNSLPVGLPFQVLAARGDLLPVAPDLGIDAVLYRSGGDRTLEAQRTRTVLDDPVDLGSSHGRLSDHPAVLTDLRIRSGTPPLRGIGTTLRWRPVAQSALGAIRDELQGHRSLMLGARAASLGVAALAVLLLIRKRQGRRLPRGSYPWARRALAAAAVGVAAWLVYLGFSYAPSQLAGLREAEGQLIQAAALERDNAAPDDS